MSGWEKSVRELSRWWLVDFLPAVLTLGALAALATASKSSILGWVWAFSVCCFTGYNFLLTTAAIDRMSGGYLSRQTRVDPIRLVAMITAATVSFTLSYASALVVRDAVAQAISETKH